MTNVESNLQQQINYMYVFFHTKTSKFSTKVLPLTISKTAYPVECGHLDDECEDVVDEGVEGFVGEHPPRQVGHRLQLVVDEQLRRHHDETCNRYMQCEWILKCHETVDCSPLLFS